MKCVLEMVAPGLQGLPRAACLVALSAVLQALVYDSLVSVSIDGSLRFDSFVLRQSLCAL